MFQDLEYVTRVIPVWCGLRQGSELSTKVKATGRASDVHPLKWSSRSSMATSEVVDVDANNCESRAPMGSRAVALPKEGIACGVVGGAIEIQKEDKETGGTKRSPYTRLYSLQYAGRDLMQFK